MEHFNQPIACAYLQIRISDLIESKIALSLPAKKINKTTKKISDEYFKFRTEERRLYR